MKRVLLSLLAVCTYAILAAPTAAAEPDAAQIIRDMREAVEPSKPSTRVLTLTAKHGGRSESLKLIQARKKLPDGTRASLTFVIEPEDARGLAYLEQHDVKGNSKEYTYAPVIRRVRELTPAESYTSFLHTDFSYGDLGFLPVEDSNEFLGTEKEGNDRVFYKIQSTPSSAAQQWYYSRYVTWIDAASKLPVKREYYSPAGELFKLEVFEDVTQIDGVPTPTKVTMNNLPAKSSSEMVVSSVSYNNGIPDEFFTPKMLHTLSDAENPAQKAALSK
ncbi:MAG: outer membrane lipoprotein-sorting protein [Candidatus Binatia bacterium]|nr:outer membrane lipoprotein-sorting protein [Candidatus Binatia bacterium]